MLDVIKNLFVDSYNCSLFKNVVAIYTSTYVLCYELSKTLNQKSQQIFCQNVTPAILPPYENALPTHAFYRIYTV